MKKDWKPQFRIILVLTFISLLIELTGRYINFFYRESNHWLYNIYIPIQGFLGLLIFSKFTTILKVKSIIKRLMIFFIVSHFLSYYFHQEFFTLNNYAIILSLVCNCIAASLFYYDVMANDVQTQLLKQPGFWFATGVFFMSVIFICRFAFWNIIISYAGYKTIFPYIINAANTFLYGGFIATFICQNFYNTNQKHYLRS